MGRRASIRISRWALLAVIAGCATDQPAARDKGGLAPVPGLTVAAVEQATRPRKVALLVGVDRYDDAFWPALKFASRDAVDLAAVLRDPKVGGFDAVEVLADPAQTDRASVLAALDRLAAQAPQADDTVLVYLSSHGTLQATPQGFKRVLVLRDTRQNNLPGSALAVRDLVARFDGLPSTRKALVLATCHSGSGKSLLTPEALRALEGIKGPPPGLQAVSRASLILSAAEFGQAAREDDRLGHDVYTHFLLEALGLGADANGDGAVTASEAHDYARRQTYAYTEGRQVPAVVASVVGVDPVVLAGRVEKPGLPVLYSYAAGLEGYEVRLDGRSKGVFPGNVVVEPGSHIVQLARGSEVLVSQRLDLAPGQRIDAEAVIERSRPRWAVGLRGAGFALLDPGLAGDTLAPVLGASLALRLRDWPWRHLDPLLDLQLGTGEQRIAPAGYPVVQQASALQLGVGAAAAMDLWRLRLYGGPHLALLVLDRRIAGVEPVEVQNFATVMPGLVAGTALQIDRFELQLEGQLHYLPLMLDGQLRSVATGNIGLGVGYRF